MRYGGICFHCKYDTYLNSLNFSDYPPQSQYETNICELCGNDAHYGYDCPPQVPFVYNQNSCFDQNFDNNFPLTSPNLSQQNLVCENCGAPHATFQFQPMNQNFNYSNSFGFDQIQPPQQFREQELLAQKQATQEKEEPPQNSDFHQLIEEMCGIKASAEQKKKLEEMMLEWLELCQEKELYCVHDSIEDLIGMAMNTMLLLINLKSQRLNMEKQEVKNIVEKATKHRTRITESLQNFTIIHKKSYISLNNRSQISLVIANTPDLPIEEPEYSLSMWDEHLSTILETESDEVIKSSVKNLVPIPSESEVTSDNENRSAFFNAESNLLESFLNQYTLIDSSPKFDYLLKEFSGKLAHINPIPPRIEEADFDLEEGIRLVKNYRMIIHLHDHRKNLMRKLLIRFLSLSPSPILVEDSDSHIEEIDLFLATDDLIPPGIENDDYDSEGDIYFLKELLSNDPLPLPENESFNFDHHDDPSFPRPPPEPPDVEVFFDFEPDTGVLTTKVVKSISEHYILMPNILPTLPTLDPDLDFTPSQDSLGSRNKIFDPGIFIEVQSKRLLSREEFSISFIRDPLYPVFDTLLPFSSKNVEKEFKPGILSYLLVSHRDKITSDFSENPMMMYGGHIPLLDIPYLHFNPP
uniref:Reverse transcriptase domain-containing protein n=1 Tax=Tanacetum cinerariifolium TaxID=118510 RepID=A0A6L2LUD3_TANCI|nr:hypothetical protein [Tanacetum cinerariifolium]